MLKSLETKMYKSFFAHIFLKNRDRFTSNHNQNNHRPILHISSTAFHQWKCFIFVIICNYPRREHVAAAQWLCKYLFEKLYKLWVLTELVPDWVCLCIHVCMAMAWLSTF